MQHDRSYNQMKKSEILGHMESGKGRPYKAVHDKFDHPSHSDFTPKEHERAAGLNREAAQKAAQRLKGIDQEAASLSLPHAVVQAKKVSLSNKIRQHVENYHKHTSASLKKII